MGLLLTEKSISIMSKLFYYQYYWNILVKELLIYLADLLAEKTDNLLT